MTNLFLKVNKDLFKLDLSPIEILTLAQIMEFQTNNMICYMTNDQFAENYGISERTFRRSLTGLVERGFITVNNPGSRSRTLTFNKEKFEEALKLGQNVQKEEVGQNVQKNTDNLSKKHGQNDLIKDKEKINLKDNSRDETTFGSYHHSLSAPAQKEFKF